MTLKLKWVLIVGAFIAIATASLLIGYSIAGFDIIAWFSTKYAIIVLSFVVVYAVFAIGVFIHDYVFKK